jgi:hypothetical protein
VAEEMEEVPVKGRHRLKVKNNRGEWVEAVLELRYRCIRILPPKGKRKRYPELTLTVLHAQERDTPTDREKIDWKLITDLPVRSRREALEKLAWYALRWKIEVFHKILKSGCKAEASKLRTAERLVNLIAIFCLLAWRIFRANHDESVRRRCTPRTGPDESGNSVAGSTGQRQTGASRATQNAVHLPHQSGPAGRLLGPCQGSPTG